MNARFFNSFRCIVAIILMGYLSPGITAPLLTDKFISFADIHFNPFSDCKSSFKACPLANKLRAANYQEWEAIFNQYGTKKLPATKHDTNYALFNSALAEWQRMNQQEHPKFGLILGDFLVHQFRTRYILYSHDTSRAGYQNFVKKTLQFMTYKIHQTFPEIDVYAAVGNNDSYRGDYASVPNGKFFQETAQTWSTLIHDQANQNSLLRTFPQGGYYAVSLSHNQKQRILILNTVLFSARAKGPHIDLAAKQELAWLHQQLVTAKEQKQDIILAFHIPVGVDIYATLQNMLTKVVMYWKPVYSDAFQAELKKFRSVVREVLPAHIHMDAFQLVMVNQLGGIPVSFTPSISPIFGNNPAFKVFSYRSETMNLTQFETYFYSLKNPKNSGWQKEYSLNLPSRKVTSRKGNSERDRYNF